MRYHIILLDPAGHNAHSIEIVSYRDGSPDINLRLYGTFAITDKRPGTNPIAEILKVCGSPAKCKKCGADIWFMTTYKGNQIPYNEDGITHFADCPFADEFRKKKGTGNASN